MLYKAKRIWFLTKWYFLLWKRAITWEISHMKVYRDYITKHAKSIIKWKDDSFRTPPLDPKAYPFDKDKAEQALIEVQRILDEENSN